MGIELGDPAIRGTVVAANRLRASANAVTLHATSGGGARSGSVELLGTYSGKSKPHGRRCPVESYARSASGTAWTCIAMHGLGIDSVVESFVYGRDYRWGRNIGKSAVEQPLCG